MRIFKRLTSRGCSQNFIDMFFTIDVREWNAQGRAATHTERAMLTAAAAQSTGNPLHSIAETAFSHRARNLRKPPKEPRLVAAQESARQPGSCILIERRVYATDNQNSFMAISSPRAALWRSAGSARRGHGAGDDSGSQRANVSH
jgi:hypothetical protein